MTNSKIPRAVSPSSIFSCDRSIRRDRGDRHRRGGRSVLVALIGALALAACGAEPAPTARSAPSVGAAPPAAPTEPTAAQRAIEAAIAPRAAAIMDAFASERPNLLADGRFTFTSTRDGLPAIYLADARAPRAPARKLRSPDERVWGARLSPDERSVLFASDVRSDGNHRVFRAPLDGSAFELLTPGESMHRDYPILNPGARDVFAFSAHDPARGAARAYLQRGAGPPRLIHRDVGAGFVIGLSPDGRRILYRQYFGEEDKILFELEEGRPPRRLFPPAGSHLRIGPAEYSVDGKTIYFAYQALNESPRVAAIAAVDGARRATYEEALPGSIEDIEVSPRGDRLAILYDGGNHSEVRLLDARTLALVSTVELGQVTAQLGTFRADGAELGLSLSRPDTPPDVFRVDVASGRLLPLREDRRPGLAAVPPMTWSIEEVASFDDLAIPVNLYLPRAARKLPTLVFIHGGPDVSAYVEWNPTVRFFSAMGFAIAEPNIRGSSGFGTAYQMADDREKRGDALGDVEAVNAWARRQPWCDPDRMVIMGTGAYGGYVALLALARHPELWRAGVDPFGMTNLITLQRFEDQRTRAYDEVEFGKLGVDDALLWEWSPVRQAHKIRAPLFVYQGAQDPTTPRGESDQIVNELRRRGVPVEYMVLPDEGHLIFRRDNRIAYHARVYRFLAEHLGITVPAR